MTVVVRWHFHRIVDAQGTQHRLVDNDIGRLKPLGFKEIFRMILLALEGYFGLANIAILPAGRNGLDYFQENGIERLVYIFEDFIYLI